MPKEKNSTDMRAVQAYQEGVVLKQIARFRELEVAKREEFYGYEGRSSLSGGGGTASS